MANSLRDVKNRIESTRSTAQTTKAMHMVSQSKVKRAERKSKDFIEFMHSISSIVKSAVEKAGKEYSHPLLVKREVKKTCYLLVTSDRGLAGGYNANIFRAYEDRLASHKSKKEFVTAAIGKKGYGYLKSKGYPMLQNDIILVRDDVMFEDIKPLSNTIVELYLSGKIDELIIIYNHYVNTLTQETKFERILPIEKLDGESSAIDYEYESGLVKTIDMMLPMYIDNIIYGIILDAKTAEHSARMNAMRSATDNAMDVIDKLQLLYNRARQNEITTELIDIIGGANAIGGKE